MTLFTRHDRMKRTFSRSAPKELLTRDQSSGGSYRLTSSADLIAYHRRLKNRTLTNWPARIHRILNVGLFFAFLAIVTGVYLSLLHCGQSDSARSEGCFTAALWACGAFTALILLKCWANSRYPQN